MRLPVFQAQAQTGAVTQLIQCRLSRSNMLSFAALQPVVSSVLLERSKLKVKQSKPSKPMKAKVAPGSIPNRRSPVFYRAPLVKDESKRAKMRSRKRYTWCKGCSCEGHLDDFILVQVMQVMQLPGSKSGPNIKKRWPTAEAHVVCFSETCSEKKIH